MVPPWFSARALVEKFRLSGWPMSTRCPIGISEIPTLLHCGKVNDTGAD